MFIKNKLKIDWKIILLTLILFIIFPLNLNFTSLPIWIYIIIYVIFWVLPVVIFYKKKIKWFAYIFLLLFYILLAIYSWYKWEKYWIEKEKENLEKVRMIQ